MQPRYEGGTEGIPPGSTCSANVYSDFHDELESDKDMSTLTRISLHVIDTVALVHAILLRAQAIQLPIFSLVLSGGH